jgi:hypothetical protein
MSQHIPENVDINKIVVDFVSKNAKDVLASVVGVGKGIFKETTDRIHLRFSQTYKTYLSHVLGKYLKTKSFFIRDEPTYLYNFYVPMGLKCGKKIIDKAYISEITQINRCVVITGTGGSGKSMLMRHLFIDSINVKEKIPIFIELRDLNQTEKSLEKLLIEFIKETLHSSKFTLDDDYINKAFDAGHFAIFLDGFDEVSERIRISLTNQIQSLAKNYDKCVIVVSSRPEDEFAGWPLFSVLKINPLQLADACELVNKLPFDDATKTKFIEELAGGVFEKHKSFLSNPLLLSIMLLTYGMTGNIPNKLSIFYNQAYEALFQNHDALKGVFQRERKSKLDIQEFATVFAAFSIQTYDKRLFSFSKSDAIDFLEKSKKLVSVDFNSNHYLKDALQSVCLLIHDGLLISFPHRSFQEYFTAYFICNSSPEKQKKLMVKYSANADTDSVLDLLYEMDSRIVEHLLVIPYLLQIMESIKFDGSNLTKDHYFEWLKLCIKEFGTGEDGKISISFNRGSFSTSLISFINRRFRNLVGWQHIEMFFDTLNCRKAVNSHEKKEKNKPDVESMEAGLFSGLDYRLKASDLNVDDDLVSVMSEGNHTFSLLSLTSLLKIKDVLVEKHKTTEQSLEEILNI